ncbi:MAG TPA: chloride channel protein [Bryobacteraceae bacterium]|nr:chloride channel protein [Bryobacteraceae bacterium]
MKREPQPGEDGFRARLAHWTGFSNREDQLMIILSLVIGLVVGLTVTAFILLTGRLAARMYPPNSAAWRRILVPTAGALVSGWLLVRYFPNARGSGIPQTKFALFIRNGVISLRTVLGKFACCSISLASGMALGREGPSVQIGAGIASIIGRRFGLGPANVKALVPVGCAAALAAAFNTPIAAVLFSLEEILGDMHAPVLGSVVLSSATSWMVLHLILGDQPLFHVPAYQLVHPLEFGIYVVLGVAGGLGSVAFVKLLLWLRMLFKRFPRSTLWLQPAAGGLGVGLMGWFMPQVLGVGYDYVDRVLGGDIPITTVAVLAILKIVATPLCYGSGNAGGIFGPSLFIGAMIGGTVGGVAHLLLPGLTAAPGAYALVGMGTAFAGIVRTPLTSVIMIFEMTRDYAIIVPLMISNLISFMISRQLQPEPIYEALALQEGVVLPTGESREELYGARVSEVMKALSEATPLLAPDSDTGAALAFLDRRQCNSWPAGEGHFTGGLISRRDLEAAPRPGMKVKDLLDSENGFPHVHADHPVSYALERMREGGVDVLPVVSRASIHEISGVIGLRDILESYGVPDAAFFSRSIPG